MTVVEPGKSALDIPQPLSLSLEAYHALGEMGFIPKKTELLYGQVFHKMPESPLHTVIFMRLLGFLQRTVLPSMHVRPEKPLTCADSEPVPDLSIVRGSIEDYAAEHPRTAEFVIEICVSSHEYDRTKLRAYADAAVKEVWLVLAPEKQVEVYRQPVTHQFRERILHGPGGKLSSAALPGFEVDLASLFESR